MQTIAELLQYERKKLLDTSRKTLLLNYQLKNNGLEIIQEWPQDLFDRLVLEQHPMTFLPAPENRNHAGEAEAYDLDRERGEFRVAHQELELESFEDEVEGETLWSRVRTVAKDTVRRQRSRGKLQTLHSEDDLTRRLIEIYKDIRKVRGALGINPYYLTLGMLEWTDKKQKTNRAPLILIPVEITRADKVSPFQLYYAEEVVEPNHTLYQKLEEESGLVLPALPLELDDFDIEAYFNQLQDAVQALKGSVNKNLVTIGLFDFRKFLMYKDLTIETWPEDSSPQNHQTISMLLRDNFKKPSLSELHRAAHIDPFIHVYDSYQIYDADSSQAIAIHDSVRGHDFIIQGPPGTGKSQTITNIIAQALGDGKKVLFVAQKKTALDVVKGNLERAGLGDVCLELHGPKTKRTTFLKEIQRALDTRPMNAVSVPVDSKYLSDLREQLNAYCLAMNSPINEDDETLFHSFEELLRLREVLKDVWPLELPDHRIFKNWSSSKYYQWLPKVERLQMVLLELGPPKNNLFRHCSYPQNEFIVPELIQQRIREVQESINGLRDACGELTDHLGLPSPITRREINLLDYVVQIVRQSPSLYGVNIRSRYWYSRANEISKVVEAVGAADRLRRKYDSVMLPDAWFKDITRLREELQGRLGFFYRIRQNFVSSVPNELKEMCRDEPPKSVREQLELVEAIFDYQSSENTIKAQEALLKELLGDHWRGLQSDWKYLSNVVNWLTKFHGAIEVVQKSVSIIDYVENRLNVEVLGHLYAVMKEQLEKYSVAVSLLVKQLQLNEDKQFGKGKRFDSQSFDQQLVLLSSWYDNVHQLSDIVDYNSLVSEFEADGFHVIVELSETWPSASKYLVELMKYTWHLGLIERCRKENKEIQAFNRIHQESRIQKFAQLDRQWIQKNRNDLLNIYQTDLEELHTNPDLQEQLATIKSQCMNAGTARYSIRRIMAEGGDVIQKLKPVFMMSPLSVAEFLPPENIRFNLVIFDEASQIRPEDALGAIIRGEQTIVVGDRYQLPPTDFFERSRSERESLTDADSILDLFYIRDAPETTLRWHYRSHHHSLIMPSNHEFYDDGLIVFPSPYTNRNDLGVKYRYIPNSVYDRGGTRKNLVEAREVARATIRHIKTQTPQSCLSLGVVALSIEQTQAIEYEVELLRQQHIECEWFFQDESESRFFVTNLENVQGDERDVIFISIGYGFDKKRNLILNFGPINQPGGERRLNVLTTRARKQCVVFSSIRARDIYQRGSTNRGVRFLAEYLEYAELGTLHRSNAVESDFALGANALHKDLSVKLFEIFNTRCAISDLKELCFPLGIDTENIHVGKKGELARELTWYLIRRNMVEQLIEEGKRIRGDIDWSELEELCKDVLEKEETVPEKDNVEGEVISNVRADSMFTSKTNIALRESYFEDDVVKTLEEYGYQVERNVGPPNSSIPIAVIDPQEKRALLGIEFDGPGYSLARSARDRDRLRQEILETNLKWKIHRIWIMDWYHSKKRETERLLSAIETVRQMPL